MSRRREPLKEPSTGKNLAPFYPIHDLSIIKNLISVDQSLDEFTQNKIYEIITDSGVLLAGHFDLLSGKHSTYFIKFSNLARYPKHLLYIAQTITEKIRQAGLEVDAILTPVTSGSYLATMLGALMSQGTRTPVEIIYAKIDDERRPREIINRDFLKLARRVLLVNDMMTTGLGMVELAKLARNDGADVAGMALFTTRLPLDTVAPAVGAKFQYCLTDASCLEEYTYNDKQCPLCKGESTLPVKSKFLN